MLLRPSAGQPQPQERDLDQVVTGRERKMKGSRNQSPAMKAAALMGRSAPFTPCRQPTLLLPSPLSRPRLPAMPPGRRSTSPAQRGKTAHSRGLTFSALPTARNSCSLHHKGLLSASPQTQHFGAGKGARVGHKASLVVSTSP